MSDIGVLVTLDEESLKEQAVLDYTSRDFLAIRAQLIGLARGYMPDWRTVGESADFGTLLMEIFAYMGDTLNYYIDRTASEAFLSTAVRRQSVFYIADMLGYMPIGQHSASVYLTFKIDVPVEEENIAEVVLPKGTRIHNTADNSDLLVIFETTEEVRLKPYGTDEEKTRRIFAEEGITRYDVPVGAAIGVPNSEFLLPDQGVIHGTVRAITTEGYETIEWSYTSDLALARPNQTVFTTYTNDQGYTTIVFGDNTSGRIPSINSKVFATYRYGVGAKANTIATDELTTIVPPANVDLSFVTVTNDASPLGGSDPETIESLKYNIPRAGARIKNRAVTLNDYADLALQVPGVAKSVSYGTVYTAVKVRIAPVNGTALPEAMAKLCEEVEQFMSDKVLIGSNVIAEPEDTDELFVDIYIRFTVHVVGTFNRSQVRRQVEALIRKMLSFDNVDFGYRVTMGQIYRAALSVQGVEWGELHWLSTNVPDLAAEPVTQVAPLMGRSARSAGTHTITQALFTGNWKHTNTHTAGDPGTGVYRTNDDAAPQWLAFSKRDSNYATTGIDKGPSILNLHIGDHVLMRPTAETWAWFDLIITSTPADNAGTPGWVSFNVVVNQTAVNPVLPTGNQTEFFEFLRYNPTPVSSGEVSDIIPTELEIPRIEPTEIIEDEDAADEVHKLTPTGTITGGTFTLTVMGQATTAAIVYNATAVAIKTAIDTAIPGNTVTVSGGPAHTNVVTLTYPGYGNVDQVIVNPSLTGTTPLITPTTSTEGVSGMWIDAGFTEEERTHDGLWVVATGGMANT